MAGIDCNTLTGSEASTVKRAMAILERKLRRATSALSSPTAVRDFLAVRFALAPREVFGVLFLDAQNRLIGLQFTVSSAGKYKTETNPYQPLSEDARRFVQSRVDDYYGMFVKAVATNRGATQTAVREGYGQGRVLGAQAALRANLVDRIATLEQVVATASMPGNKRGSYPRVAASERLLTRLVQGGSSKRAQPDGKGSTPRLDAAIREFQIQGVPIIKGRIA